MTNDELAALDRAATQEVWEIELDQYDKPFPGICPQGSPFDMASFTMGENADENLANAQLTVALVNLYRANQLVLIGPDAVEVVAWRMWKAEADRAAPNVGRNRTLEAFRDASPDERERWLALAALGVK